jgi:hypothetical protein
MHRGSRITCFLQGLLRMLLQALQAVSICTFVPVRKQVLVLVKPPAGVFLQALRMMLQTLTYALSRCSSLAAPSSPRFEQCAASPLPLRHIHISIFTFFLYPVKRVILRFVAGTRSSAIYLPPMPRRLLPTSPPILPRGTCVANRALRELLVDDGSLWGLSQCR